MAFLLLHNYTDFIIFYSTYFENVNDILSCIISILLSPVLFGIGIGLKKLTKHNKTA